MIESNCFMLSPASRPASDIFWVAVAMRVICSAVALPLLFSSISVSVVSLMLLPVLFAMASAASFSCFAEVNPAPPMRMRDEVRRSVCSLLV